MSSNTLCKRVSAGSNDSGGVAQPTASAPSASSVPVPSTFSSWLAAPFSTYFDNNANTGRPTATVPAGLGAGVAVAHTARARTQQRHGEEDVTTTTTTDESVTWSLFRSPKKPSSMPPPSTNVVRSGARSRSRSRSKGALDQDGLAASPSMLPAAISRNIEELDLQLERYPLLNSLEDLVGVSKVYISLVMMLFLCSLVFFGFGNLSLSLSLFLFVPAFHVFGTQRVHAVLLPITSQVCGRSVVLWVFFTPPLCLSNVLKAWLLKKERRVWMG